jgi:hypothetical protein
MISPQHAAGTQVNPAIYGAFGGASANSGAAKPGAVIMSSPTLETASKSPRIVPKTAVKVKAASGPAIKTSKNRSASKKSSCSGSGLQTTKQDRVLALLRQHDGASIEEIMQATNWQRHSVRGFFAGTVKKKLGLTFTSSKADGQSRRYRIETRRGR